MLPLYKMVFDHKITQLSVSVQFFQKYSHYLQCTLHISSYLSSQHFLLTEVILKEDEDIIVL